VVLKVKPFPTAGDIAMVRPVVQAVGLPLELKDAPGAPALIHLKELVIEVPAETAELTVKAPVFWVSR
jgi:translation initiation factor 2 alpha subunit (eIF-2alpha)